MGKLHYGEGAITIEMDDTLDRLVRRALDRVAPGVVKRIESATRQVFLQAHHDWPVKTGESRDGLRWEVIVSDTSIRGRISNAVDYVYYIRPKEFYGSTTAWAAFVQRPMRAAATKFVQDFGPELRRLLGG